MGRARCCQPQLVLHCERSEVHRRKTGSVYQLHGCTGLSDSPSTLFVVALSVWMFRRVFVQSCATWLMHGLLPVMQGVCLPIVQRNNVVIVQQNNPDQDS